MSLTRLCVLVVGYVWPEPRSSAAGGHMMQLLGSFLSAGWQVTFASPATLGEHKADLAELGIAECAITLNDSSFDVFVEELAPNVVLFDRFMMEEQFGWRVAKHCPQALRVLETCDLHGLRDARQQLLKARLKAPDASDDFSDLFSAALDGVYPAMAAADVTLREIAALYRCDLNLMISDVELQLLVQQFGVPASLLHWCPLMLDARPRPSPDFAERAHFLSIGNFRHEPNWDAVLWLKNSIWPLIRQQLPEAQLHIYGAYTPPKATALHNARQGFHVLGWADDALEVMAQARVNLAPLRFGAGIKGKLADAMLCGTPSVTTPIGAEAMHGALPWPGAVARSASALAEAAVALYCDESRWQQARTQAQQVLASRYDIDLHSAALVARIETLLPRLAEHRLQNFTGAMLQHHQHKSTQYMAQWIEAKNRAAKNARPQG
ncbi:glycosyltransferase [Pseudomonas sp. dw_358]|uniref:glycosyltransferase n=1 Tax=Pseudomonas sp. dw_358 TaxID=2720083 RepID=UPI002116F3C6|nr:glycosyltransferase [Pseudomonas sp. dw_358]